MVEVFCRQPGGTPCSKDVFGGDVGQPLQPVPPARKRQNRSHGLVIATPGAKTALSVVAGQLAHWRTAGASVCVLLTPSTVSRCVSRRSVVPIGVGAVDDRKPGNRLY